VLGYHFFKKQAVFAWGLCIIRPICETDDAFVIFVCFVSLILIFIVLYGLVIRIPGYISRGSGFDSRTALPGFLRSSGYGTDSTEPREYN
jgi:hypothetical protein